MVGELGEDKKQLFVSSFLKGETFGRISQIMRQFFFSWIGMVTQQIEKCIALEWRH